MRGTGYGFGFMINSMTTPEILPRIWQLSRGKIQRVAYKGGSEAGVINMTQALQHRESGEWICVSATWNSTKEHLSQDGFVALLVRILHPLSK